MFSKVLFRARLRCSTKSRTGNWCGLLKVCLVLQDSQLAGEDMHMQYAEDPPWLMLTLSYISISI